MARVLARVPSFTHPTTTPPYEIERAGERLLCACPAFSFGKRAAKTCKHVRLYMAAERAAARCRERHGGDGAHVCMQCLVELLAATVGKAQRLTRQGRRRD